MCAAPNPNPNIPPQYGSYPPPLPQYGYPYYPIPPGQPPYPYPYPYPAYEANEGSGKSRSHGKHHSRRSRDGHSSSERRQQEKKTPIHTVFFCNIPYEVTYDEFSKYASRYGVPTNIYTKFERGIAFVTYNDLREAKNAVLSDSESLYNRRIKKSYAESPMHKKKDPHETCSTVLVTSLATFPKITLDDVKQQFEKFGEIFSSRVGDGDGEFVVNFYKITDARKCIDSNGMDVKNETLKIEYLPDEEANPGNNIEAKNDAPMAPPPPPPTTTTNTPQGMISSGIMQQGIPQMPQYPPPQPPVPQQQQQNVQQTGGQQNQFQNYQNFQQQYYPPPPQYQANNQFNAPPPPSYTNPSVPPNPSTPAAPSQNPPVSGVMPQQQQNYMLNMPLYGTSNVPQTGYPQQAEQYNPLT